MYDDEELQRIRAAKADWEDETLADAGERRDRFATVPNLEVDRLYTPHDVAGLDYEADLGFPGEEPYTRGVYPTIYRGRQWTMRQFAGFGTAEETNDRFHYLTEAGQTGLSTAFDMSTLTGLDSDDPMADGEVGKEGVAVDTLSDMARLFDGIDLGEVSVSFTINPSAPVGQRERRGRRERHAGAGRGGESRRDDGRAHGRFRDGVRKLPGDDRRELRQQNAL